MSSNKYVLTPNISNILRIIALVLMFCHHFFNPTLLVEGNTYSTFLCIKGISLEEFLCDVGKLCVSLFALLSGYGLYFSFLSEKAFENMIVRICNFIRAYWITLIIVFVPLLFIVGYSISGSSFILSFIAIDSTLNIFCWYVFFYVVAVPSLYIFHCMQKKYFRYTRRRISLLIIIIILMPFLNFIFCEPINNFFMYFPSMIVGYIIAKYRFYDKAVQVVDSIVSPKFHLLLGILGAVTLLVIRYAICIITKWRIYTEFDALLASIFVLCGVLVFRNIPAKHEKIIRLLGKATANMWYLHAMFFGVYAPNTQWLPYFPRLSLLVILWTYFLLLIPALCLDKITEGINARYPFEDLINRFLEFYHKK